MRVAGFVRARNEEDILEASIRHNLTVVDALLVLDHCSDDATPEILAALVREGLPIELQREDSLGLPEPEIAVRCVDHLLERGADVCIPLDADEFLQVPSRTTFEEMIRGTDPARSLALSVRTYLPALDVAGDLTARLRHARTVSGASEASTKAFVLPTAAARSSAAGHAERGGILSDGHVAPLAGTIVPAAVAGIARVPIRSAEQFTAKIAVGHLARALGGGDECGAFRWHDEYAALLAGERFTPERLTAIVARYGLPIGQELDPRQAEWVDAPFPIDIRLAHTPTHLPNALARILLFGERVAVEIAQRTGGR